MKLLLDTNAALWFALDHPSLSQPAKLAIEASGNEVLISPASHWEIAIKISLGKYKLHAAGCLRSWASVVIDSNYTNRFTASARPNWASSATTMIGPSGR